MNINFHQQRGVALLVSLILLLLLTIIAITAASTSTLQQRMANNAQDQNTSFQAAESGLANWMRLFNAGTAIPAGNQPAGNNTVFNLSVNTQANCLPISLNVSGGFEFTCHHVTSNAETATGARSRHQMGYLERIGL